MIIVNTMQLMLEIKKIMLEDKITQSELAKRLNKTRPALAQIFKAENPRANTLIEICDALDLNFCIERRPKDGE